MEYLVEMTTHVPSDVVEGDVAAMRAREAVVTRELAVEGRVLRLWRPRLRPGEWRTRGLFSAGDGAELEETLTSMPLHVWRHDEVTPLRPHGNDPGPAAAAIDPESLEFFTTFVLSVPPQASAERVALLGEREAERTRELAEAGKLRRLWRLPGVAHNLGLWQAGSRRELDRHLRSLPLAGWLTVTTEPVSRHPSDPSATQAPSGAA